jgi:hypothetical protein
MQVNLSIYYYLVHLLVKARLELKGFLSLNLDKSIFLKSVLGIGLGIKITSTL